MNPDTTITESNPRPQPTERQVVAPRTKNQIRASALADGVAARAKWKTLIAEAKTIWTLISPEELTRAEGNFHKIAGLVQLRYHLSRGDADRQVHDFLDKHYPAA
jgi:hypothetical protein